MPREIWKAKSRGAGGQRALCSGRQGKHRAPPDAGTAPRSARPPRARGWQPQPLPRCPPPLSVQEMSPGCPGLCFHTLLSALSPSLLFFVYFFVYFNRQPDRPRPPRRSPRNPSRAFPQRKDAGGSACERAARLSCAWRALEAAYAGPCPGDGRIASAMPGPGRPCNAAPRNRASAARSAEVRVILREDARVSGGPYGFARSSSGRGQSAVGGGAGPSVGRRPAPGSRWRRAGSTPGPHRLRYRQRELGVRLCPTRSNAPHPGGCFRNASARR